MRTELGYFSLVVLKIVHSSKLQFNLSVCIIGVIYLGCELIHTVGIISAGQVTDRLVSFYSVKVLEVRV